MVYIYNLDDKYPIGFGKGLSFKPINYEMAIKSADGQREVKMRLAGNDKELQKQVQIQYEKTIKLAHYYACFRMTPFAVLRLSRAYPFISTKDIIRTWLGYCKTRMKHTIKCILNTN